MYRACFSSQKVLKSHKEDPKNNFFDLSNFLFLDQVAPDGNFLIYRDWRQYRSWYKKGQSYLSGQGTWWHEDNRKNQEGEPHIHLSGLYDVPHEGLQHALVGGHSAHAHQNVQARQEYGWML